MGGVDFLRDVSLGKKVELGQRVIVIGGGNVAYDVARTVLRQEEYDVSRTAARMAGVRQVDLVCLESLEEMPADTVEILEGQEEGVTRHNSWDPGRFWYGKQTARSSCAEPGSPAASGCTTTTAALLPSSMSRSPQKSKLTPFCFPWASQPI